MEKRVKGWKGWKQNSWRGWGSWQVVVKDVIRTAAKMPLRFYNRWINR